MKFHARRAIMPALVALTFSLVSYSAGAGDNQSTSAKSKRPPQRAQSGAVVSDPSIGASCAYDRAAGRCMIDLGNGRCMDCNAGPMK